MSIKLKASEDLVPITELRQNSAGIVEKLRATGRPIVITQRGRSAAVLEDVRQYEHRVARLELLEAIVRGLQDADEGRLVDPEAVMRQLKAAAIG